MLGRMLIGVDLGTASVLVYTPRHGITVREPSVVALDHLTRHIVAIGEPAERMLGRTPANLIAVRPLRDGVIADYDVTEAMLRHFLNKARGHSFLKPIVVICVPARVTEVEKRAVIEAAISAGAKRAYLIEEPLAAAIGAGLGVEEPRGCMVVDIGGGTTDIAIMSLGAVAVSDTVRVAGDKMDEAIVRDIRKRHKLLIGERTAEAIKLQIGAARPSDELHTMEIRGRDLVDGMPKSVVIDSKDVFEALEEPVSMIVDAVKSVLEKAPPELAADLIDRGIMMTGGGSLLRGLDKRLAEATGMQVQVADDPITCVVIGTGKADALRLAS